MTVGREKCHSTRIVRSVFLGLIDLILQKLDPTKIYKQELVENSDAKLRYPLKSKGDCVSNEQPLPYSNRLNLSTTVLTKIAAERNF